MAEITKITDESAAVQAHLSISQAIIQRMASNSASCKAWCITLVSAILVIVADKGKPHYAFIAFIPTALFFILDTYYLSLERCFRESYNGFIMKLHGGNIEPRDVYYVKPAGSLLKTFPKCLVSFSVWPFYLTLGVMIWLTKALVIG